MGAARNQIYENETFDSLADLYLNSIDKRIAVEAELARLREENAELRSAGCAMRCELSFYEHWNWFVGGRRDFSSCRVWDDITTEPTHD